MHFYYKLPGNEVGRDLGMRPLCFAAMKANGTHNEARKDPGVQVACRPNSNHRICFIWALLVGEICNEVFQKVNIKNFIINQHDFVTLQMLTKRKENIPVSACLKSKVLPLCISLRASSPFIGSKATKESNTPCTQSPLACCFCVISHELPQMETLLEGYLCIGLKPL